ncbi:MAG: glycine C-acetyltransferase [Gemmatimonadaceae bacterium]|nr:glycine C-acetyltransferase [Gemmatimonadaceae bacterium]
MYGTMKEHLEEQLARIEEDGLYKRERVIAGPQQAAVDVAGRHVLNMCANNYLGLAGHPEIVEAARASLDEWGYGLSSVRFICGTQPIHHELESRIAEFLGTEAAILYSSCFDANGGLFETLLGPEDAVISDELNHASIIDGIRLCKARRLRYRNSDLQDLEAKLVEAAGCRFRLVVTDGVFSMDGIIADLKGVCDLADEHGAMVMIDDSHAVGFLGDNGRGTHELCQVMDRVDIITGTLGKALGGASGGYTSGRREIVDLLRQRSRPYLFSNTLAPSIVSASLKALEIIQASSDLRERLHANTRYFKAAMKARGFDLNDGEHPIVPIMLGDAVLAQKVAARLLEKGVFAIGFFYPVVPEGRARIRTQISAAHSREDLDLAVQVFAEVKEEYGF